jgi:hypothetical protein
MAVTTRGDLIRHIGLELGLDRTAATEEYLLMVDWAQDAVYDFIIETRAVLSKATLPLVAGQSDYSLAAIGTAIVAPILEIADMQLTSGGTRYSLERVTLEEILDWRRTSQANDRARSYAIEGDLLAVYPTPASADTITAYIVVQPSVMDTDARDFTTPAYGGISVQHAPVLLAYMRWRASLYDERKVPHTPKDYRDQYAQLLDEAKRRMRKMGGRRSPGMKAGYPGAGGNPGRRNDIYPAS